MSPTSRLAVLFSTLLCAVGWERQSVKSGHPGSSPTLGYHYRVYSNSVSLPLFLNVWPVLLGVRERHPILFSRPRGVGLRRFLLCFAFSYRHFRIYKVSYTAEGYKGVLEAPVLYQKCNGPREEILLSQGQLNDRDRLPADRRGGGRWIVVSPPPHLSAESKAKRQPK